MVASVRYPTQQCETRCPALSDVSRFKETSIQREVVLFKMRPLLDSYWSLCCSRLQINSIKIITAIVTATVRIHHKTLCPSY